MNPDSRIGVSIKRSADQIQDAALIQSIHQENDGALINQILPEELIVRIFSLLEPRHFPSIALSCRQWCRLGSDEQLWKGLYRKIFPVFHPVRSECWRLDCIDQLILHRRAPAPEQTMTVRGLPPEYQLTCLQNGSLLINSSQLENQYGILDLNQAQKEPARLDPQKLFYNLSNNHLKSSERTLCAGELRYNEDKSLLVTANSFSKENQFYMQVHVYDAKTRGCITTCRPTEKLGQFQGMDSKGFGIIPLDVKVHGNFCSVAVTFEAGEGGIRIWDIQTGAYVGSIALPRFCITHYFKDKKLYFVVRETQEDRAEIKLITWSLEKNAAESAESLSFIPNLPVNTAFWGAYQDDLLILRAQGKVGVFQNDEPVLPPELHGNLKAVWTEGRLLVAGNAEGGIIIWDRENRKVVSTIRTGILHLIDLKRIYKHMFLLVHQDPSNLAQGIVQLWDFENGLCVRNYGSCLHLGITEPTRIFLTDNLKAVVNHQHISHIQLGGLIGQLLGDDAIVHVMESELKIFDFSSLKSSPASIVPPSKKVKPPSLQA